MADLKGLREKRGRLAEEARSIIDTAEKEKRALTQEESDRFDKMHEEIASLRSQIEREERQKDLERELAATPEAEENRTVRPGATEEEQRVALTMRGFAGYLASGRITGEGAEEFRALQATANTEGGYLIAPEQFVNTLIQNVDDTLWIRQRAQTFQLGRSASIGVPTLEADPADADWTTELQTGTDDSTMSFGKRSMTPHPVAKRIKVSNQLLRTATIGAEPLVRSRLAYKFAVTQEKAFLTGSGAGQPLGVFTASADGVPTTRDVSTGNTGTSITFDGLIEAKYSLKQQYWGRADWLFHRDAMKQIAKLKDGEGQFLWRESVRDGEPDRLLGRPLMMSEYAPNTFTTGLYVGMFADFSNYWIVDSIDLQIQRLVELYAETNQAGFIGRYEGDGAPVLPEAFARVKLG